MKNEALIRILNECAAHCNHCADACLDEQDVKMMLKCIRLDRICSATCTATAQTLAVSSLDVGGLVVYCAEICEKCGTECGKHKAEHCQRCAEACINCARACREYAA